MGVRIADAYFTIGLGLCIVKSNGIWTDSFSTSYSSAILTRTMTAAFISCESLGLVLVLYNGERPWPRPIALATNGGLGIVSKADKEALLCV